jgi:two-component system, NarL family, invasion response regulator UvrY
LLNVLIVEDHPVVQKGLSDFLRESFEDIRIDWVRTGREFMENIKEHDHDIVLLDISLPDVNGLDTLKDVRRRRPHLPVLIVSVYPEELYAIRAIRTGANGYLTKQCEPEELIEAVRTLLSGRKYINPGFAGKMIENFESYTEKPAHERLSNIEFQVMRMLGSGKSVKDIASELKLSINSIRMYRLHIMKKIGAKGTESLIHYALTHGIT